MTSTIIHQHFPLQSCSNHNRNPFTVHAHQNVVVQPHQNHQKQNQVVRLAQSLSNLVHLHLGTPSRATDWNLLNQVHHTTPTTSPKENISRKWREIHGSMDFDGLLDPIHPWLRREIIKYGEFAQATYDAFDFDSFSEYCGSCRYNQHKFFNKLGLSGNGYKVTKYIYAMSHVDIPHWLQRSHLVETWSKDSNWMGYVAVSDDEETRRIGRRDIVVAWRGTIAPSEWFEDLQGNLKPIGNGDVKVEHGFHHLYTSKSESTRYNKSSASEQVMKEVNRLVGLFQQRGEEVSLTTTGHSLGGALALLNAYEAAEAIPDLPISVISFGAPRVGNIAFRNKLHQMGVKTLRVVVKQDILHRMPGIMFNEGLQRFEDILGTLDWVYTHVGTELRLDIGSSPYLKQGLNFAGYHSLETYLHLVDGYISSNSPFRSDARRDVALVNKACGMLIDELKIPECWYQFANKGLVRNSYGRWVKPSRDPENLPSPHSETKSRCFAWNLSENQN